jgi:hypothetical protein
MLNENEQLFEQNCEKEIRESANARTVRKVMMMKYEDIQKAKQLRDQKELKKQSGRGRRSKEHQQDVPERAKLDEFREGDSFTRNQVFSAVTVLWCDGVLSVEFSSYQCI